MTRGKKLSLVFLQNELILLRFTSEGSYRKMKYYSALVPAKYFC